MDVLSTVVNAAVVGIAGALLAWFSKGRFDALDHRIDRLEARLDRRLDGMQTSLDALRSDLTQVATSVGVRPRSSNG
jgi:hypothetical protein